MPKRRTAAKLRGISHQQLGERVKRSANGHVGLYPKNRHVGSRLLIVDAVPVGKQPREFRMLLFTLQRIESPTSPGLADPDPVGWV